MNAPALDLCQTDARSPPCATRRSFIETLVQRRPSAADGAAPPVRPAGRHALRGRRIGPYRIERRLGSGGVGEVFQAHDILLGRPVAIKLLRPELAADAAFPVRFHHEAKLLARLDHPNIARVLNFLCEGDTQYMVMELVAGVTLDKLIRARGALAPARAVGIFRQVLEGIGHAHRAGVVHRDIKPANIMLGRDGVAKVMDFGVARSIDFDAGLTRVGQIPGTAKYMSPEQVRGSAADARSDIYSLGIVLYMLLAGRAPFEGDSQYTLLKAQVEQPPPPLATLVPDVPPLLEAAVMRALAKQPADRFPSVAAFAAALDAWLAATPPEQAPRLARSVSPGGQVRAFAAHCAAAWRGLRRWERAVAMASPLLFAIAAGALVAALGTVPGAPRSADGRPIGVPTDAATLVPPAPLTLAGPAPLALEIAHSATDGPQAASPAFAPGEQVHLTVTPSRDAHVYCYLQDEARRIVRFYPNRFAPIARVAAGAPLRVPGRMGFELIASRERVPETVACFATERDVGAALPAAVFGVDFAALAVRSLDEVASAFAAVDAGRAQARFEVGFR